MNAEPRPVELLRALAVLGEPPGPEHARVAAALGLPAVPTAAEYSDVFLFQLYPYASVHLGPEGMLGGEARDRVAGFWTAVGRVPPAEPDHLSALVALYASLADEESAASAPEAVLVRQGRSALLYEHLAPWAFFYLGRVRELASGFYGAWARLLEDALAAELRESELTGSLPGLPLHLRAAPALDDPREAGAPGDPSGAGVPTTEPAPGFVAELLAPARSGMILTRSDLALMAASERLGLRAGERRFALQSMLGLDAPAVLSRLAAEAARQADAHDARRPLLGAIADFWSSRARRTASLLTELAAQAAAEEPGAAIPAGAPASA